MTHTIQGKTRLLNRVRRIKGQVEAIERALLEEKGCTNILHLVSAIRGAINGLMAEVMEDHIRHHLTDPAHEPDIPRAIEELIDSIRSYVC